MALTVRNLAVVIDAVYSSQLDLGVASAPLTKSYTTALTSGTGAGQADKMWHDQRTLTAGASEDLDLAGVLTDAFGAIVTLARIKGLIISAAAANPGVITVGGVTNGLSTILKPAATGTLDVRPGTTFAVLAGQADATGYAVTATTADLLHVAAAATAGNYTYDVIVVGASA